jgi:hypothetical protein
MILNLEPIKKEFPTDENHYASEVLSFMINMLKEETDFKTEDEESMIRKFFNIEINHAFICQKDHIKQLKRVSFIHNLAYKETVKSYIEKEFKSKRLDEGCHIDANCTSILTKDKRRTMHLPQFLIFTYPIDEMM